MRPRHFQWNNEAAEELVGHLIDLQAAGIGDRAF